MVAAMNDGLFGSIPSLGGDKCPDAADSTLSRLSTAVGSTARLYSYPPPGVPLPSVPLEACLLRLRFPGDNRPSIAGEGELDDALVAPVAARSALFFFAGGGGFGFGFEFFWKARDAPCRAAEAEVEDCVGGFMSRRETRKVGVFVYSRIESAYPVPWGNPLLAKKSGASKIASIQMLASMNHVEELTKALATETFVFGCGALQGSGDPSWRRSVSEVRGRNEGRVPGAVLHDDVHFHSSDSSRLSSS
jgi:hypothetical protein